MDVCRKVLPAAGVLDEVVCLRFPLGREVDDDVQVAVELHPVLSSRAEDEKPPAMFGAECPHLGHDKVGRGATPCGLTGLPLGNGHDAGHRLLSTKRDFPGKYKQLAGNWKGARIRGDGYRFSFRTRQAALEQFLRYPGYILFSRIAALLAYSISFSSIRQGLPASAATMLGSNRSRKNVRKILTATELHI